MSTLNKIEAEPANRLSVLASILRNPHTTSEIAKKIDADETSIAAVLKENGHLLLRREETGKPTRYTLNLLPTAPIPKGWQKGYGD